MKFFLLICLSIQVPFLKCITGDSGAYIQADYPWGIPNLAHVPRIMLMPILCSLSLAVFVNVNVGVMKPLNPIDLYQGLLNW